MNRLLHSPIGLLVRRIALLYVVLLLCRILFYAYNAPLLGPLAWADTGTLLRGALLFDTASIAYADGLFVLLSLLPLPARIRAQRWWRSLLYGYYVTVNAVLVVATNLADAVYFRYTQKRFTADEILFADTDNSFALVLKFAAENWYLVLAAVLLTVLLARGYGRRLQETPLLREGWGRYVGSTLLFVLGAGLCIAGIRGGFTRTTRPITLSNAALYAPDNARANLILSNPFCILRTAGDGERVRTPHYFAPERLAQLFTPVHEPADSAAVDLTGRNIVLFVLESMSAEHSARLCPEIWSGTAAGGGMTPFLDSLMAHSLTFERMYANGTRSIQALPSILGSIPSFRTPFVLLPQSLGRSRQLPAMLADRGYATLFFCGSERGSMGFGAYARSAGVERLVSREEYEAVHGTGDFDGYWGIWDEPFIGFAGEVLATVPEPFFAALFTLSSHHPFVVPAAEAASLPDGYTKIHKGVAYVDRTFRRFFARFSHEEWFRRTIFVFVADHVSSEKFAPATREWPGNRRIMGFIHTPDGALQGSVTEIAQQLDIMPTLLGLTGNRERYFAFGRDVLNEPDRPRWSVGYDGRYRALTEAGTVSFDEQQAADTVAGSPQGRFQALVQHYYDRIERQDYTAE